MSSILLVLTLREERKIGVASMRKLNSNLINIRVIQGMFITNKKKVILLCR